MKLLKGILSLINFILMVIIILNILNLISTKILKDAYPSILDYTYYHVTENNNSLGTKNGDLVLIDIKKVINKEDLVLYKINNHYEIGKIKEMNSDTAVIKNKEEAEINKEEIVGASITVIPTLGTILSMILEPITLIIAILILIITSIIQSKISKKIETKASKPDFKALKDI